MMKYAILGGGGAFGIHTAFYLLQQPDTSRVLSIGRSPLRGEPFSLGIERQKNFTYVQRHITYEFDLLMELLDKERPDVIINFAAQGEGAASWHSSWRFFETNAMALSRLVEALCERRWMRRFIHIGTSEVYGSMTEPASEDAPIRPTSPYAASKVAFDYYLQAMCSRMHFPMNILRPSNAYCPGQALHRVIPRTVLYALTGRKLPLHGGGMAQKSYIHARDLARAIYLVVHKARLGRIYNVGPEKPTPIWSIVRDIAFLMDVDYGEICELANERHGGQDAVYWLNSTAAKDDLGWEPEVPLSAGLSEMIEWGRTYLDEIRNMPVDYVLRA
jgi:dTDP-glucose 4,6-dehydratase